MLLPHSASLNQGPQSMLLVKGAKTFWAAKHARSYLLKKCVSHPLLALNADRVNIAIWKVSMESENRLETQALGTPSVKLFFFK